MFNAISSSVPACEFYFACLPLLSFFPPFLPFFFSLHARPSHCLGPDWFVCPDCDIGDICCHHLNGVCLLQGASQYAFSHSSDQYVHQRHLAAIAEALITLSRDPLLIWNYAVFAILTFVGGTLFIIQFWGLDKEEDELNNLPGGHVQVSETTEGQAEFEHVEIGPSRG